MQHAATAPAPNWVRLAPGDRAPAFSGLTQSGTSFRFDVVAGRWLVLGFFCSCSEGGSLDALRQMNAATDVFDNTRAALFAVSHDREDGLEELARQSRFIAFMDHDRAIARLYGSAPQTPGEGAGRRFWVIVDPALMIRRVIPMRADGSDAEEVLAWLRDAPPPETHMGFETPAPILVLPHVFEPAFCDHLVQLYRENGGIASGVMRDQDGRTVPVMDASFKSRRDFVIQDKKLIGTLQNRILRRVVPEIARVHYFNCTRMERYIVSCYAAEEGGHFSPHRDNTTIATAHRRYAISINLNEDFEGGEVSFPEYGARSYKAPKGGAVIFSCSMLHAVSKVTQGERFAFLPFLYDEAAAAIREQNAAPA